VQRRQALLDDLERQYEQSRARKFQQGSAGLGASGDE